MSWARKTQLLQPLCVRLCRRRYGSSKGCWIRRSAVPGTYLIFASSCVRVAPVAFQIVSDDLNVDRSRQSEIQNLADHVSGQESERNPRKLFWQCQAKLVNVVVRGMVIGGQGHKDVGVRCPDRRGIAVREIDAAVGQADVVDDALRLRRRNLLSNRLLNQIAKVGGLFNAHSRRSTQMKLESAAVYAGEEVLAQPGNQNCQ